MDGAERRCLLNFLVVGGDGPVGMEMVGAITEPAKVALARDFHHIDPRNARVPLIEAGPRILPTFPKTPRGARRRRWRGSAWNCASAEP